MDGGGSNQHHSPTHNTRTGLGITIVSRTLYTVTTVVRDPEWNVLYTVQNGDGERSGSRGPEWSANGI